MFNFSKRTAERIYGRAGWYSSLLKDCNLCQEAGVDSELWGPFSVWELYRIWGDDV
jgi:hypothetical protein